MMKNRELRETPPPCRSDTEKTDSPALDPDDRGEQRGYGLYLGGVAAPTGAGTLDKATTCVFATSAKTSILGILPLENLFPEDQDAWRISCSTGLEIRH